jgi:aspartate/tyrosine/aromatic aminotransferase
MICIINLGNHRAIILETDHPDIREYRYYDRRTRWLDYQGMLEDLRVCY